MDIDTFITNIVNLKHLVDIIFGLLDFNTYEFIFEAWIHLNDLWYFLPSISYANILSKANEMSLKILPAY